MKAPNPMLPKLGLAAGAVEIEADGNFNDDPTLLYTRLSNKDAVSLAGVSLHMELIEVDGNGDAVNPSLQSQVDAITTLCGERPQELGINGRQYVAVLFPHAA